MPTPRANFFTLSLLHLLHGADGQTPKEEKLKLICLPAFGPPLFLVQIKNPRLFIASTRVFSSARIPKECFKDPWRCCCASMNTHTHTRTHTNKTQASKRRPLIFSKYHKRLPSPLLRTRKTGRSCSRSPLLQSVYSVPSISGARTAG